MKTRGKIEIAYILERDKKWPRADLYHKILANQRQHACQEQKL
jgi:hypothetical protein